MELDQAFEMVEVSTLSAHPENPRSGDVELIGESIRVNGFFGAIVAQRSTGRILAGNHRWKAAKSEGRNHVPVAWVDVDDEHALRILLADNRTNDVAGYDDSRLAGLLAELSETCGLEGTGYSAEDLEQLLTEVQPDEPDTGDHGIEASDAENAALDALPERVEAKTKKGEVVELGRHRLHCIDCLELMRSLEESSIDAIVTDPPYGIGFMGKGWDVAVPGDEFAREAFRILKPGGHLIAFAATRTVHRLTVAIEDAGLEIRDQIGWLQWQGFPKSLDVSKAIDKMKHNREQVLVVTRWIAEARDRAGLKNSDIDRAFGFAGMAGHWTSRKSQPSVPTLDQVPKLLELLGSPSVPPEIDRLLIDLNTEKNQPGPDWQKRETVGFHSGDMGGLGGQRLGAKGGAITSPATEKSRSFQGWGTALKPSMEPAVLARKPLEGTVAENVLKWGTGGLNIDAARIGYGDQAWPGPQETGDPDRFRGTNDGSFVAALDKPEPRAGHNLGRWPANIYHAAKPSRGEREEGCEELPGMSGAQAVNRNEETAGLDNPRAGAGRTAGHVKNYHPTVKPTKLMRWLLRLVTPGADAVVLEPFAGSGTTLIAAEREGFKVIAAELAPEYCDIIRARVEKAMSP